MTARGTLGPITTGTPGFMIPAFSRAIFSTVSPRMCVCSRLIDVMTDWTGVMTLVESRRPLFAHAQLWERKNNNATHSREQRTQGPLQWLRNRLSSWKSTWMLESSSSVTFATQSVRLFDKRGWYRRHWPRKKWLGCHVVEQHQGLEEVVLPPVCCKCNTLCMSSCGIDTTKGIDSWPVFPICILRSPSFFHEKMKDGVM